MCDFYHDTCNGVLGICGRLLDQHGYGRTRERAELDHCLGYAGYYWIGYDLRSAGLESFEAAFGLQSGNEIIRSRLVLSIEPLCVASLHIVLGGV